MCLRSTTRHFTSLQCFHTTHTISPADGVPDAIKDSSLLTMATSAEQVELNFPKLPAKHDQFLQYVAAHPKKSMLELLEPYKQYDAELRKAFAQQPDHPAVKQPNVLPIFAGHEKQVTVRARDLDAETEKERDCFIMPLRDGDRKPDGAPAIVQSLKDFQTNFSVFSESSLADLDWSNVIVAGSAALTSLLAVPEKHTRSKRALRRYYHEQLAPASDVDLFLYGLTEDQAIDKIKQIERNVRDALLVETTTVRTKNAITIASKHPIRHVQIVLRLYKNISEILTGFDVDCSCVAYDGKQVYASPRALVSYMTQFNTIDLSRRSPSYENRLSKYAHRGFEVYWPLLDRSRIDPTIYERSFGRTKGLARLLILEKLPKNEDRESYLDQRRAERGRPPVYRNRYRGHVLFGNIKDQHDDEVADWVGEEVSDYHTVTVPYGGKFHAKKIEKLLFTKDMLLNAEWNKPKDREVNLHRHPAFFGSVEDVVGDCCGCCPEPRTVEEEEVAEEESKIFITGPLKFMQDDPGRQAIGSFNPIDAEGWTEMAYVGNTAHLCQAIIEEDVDYVTSWLAQESNDPNTRDYTGRTPLHFAVTNSSAEVVQALIDGGARLVARLVDGRTALHLATMRGNVEMVSALLRKSAANEEENEEKVDARRAARKAAKANKSGVSRVTPPKEAEDDTDTEMVEGSDADTDMHDVTTEGSLVDIRKPQQKSEDAMLADEDEDEPDVYDVNVVAWDTAVSPLHLAIVQGHNEVVKCLVQEFGADVLLPIKLFNDHDKSARAAVLTLVLAMQLGFEKAQEMVMTLISLGASVAQADVDQRTVLQFCVADRPDMLDNLGELDTTGVKRAINHIAAEGYRYSPTITSPLFTAIQAKDAVTALRLLAAGANPEIDFSAYVKAMRTQNKIDDSDSKRNKKKHQEDVKQPIFTVVENDLPAVAKSMIIDYGVDSNAISNAGWVIIHNEYRRRYGTGQSLLDVVRERRKTLQDWKFKQRIPKAPVPVKEDATYLAEYKEGTYAYFSAKRQVESARSSYESDLERYEKDMKEAKESKGVEEKQQAIHNLVSGYDDLENTLLDRGAKGFYELHPEIKESQPCSPRGSYGYDTPGPTEYLVCLDFKVGDLTDKSREKYLQLFEAAWSGDLAKVKGLTLNPWKDTNGDGQPPLKVAVQDDQNLNPFAIAVLQGHEQLATAIMEISRAQQFVPEPSKRRRYGIEDDEDMNIDDEDSEHSDDDVKLYSEIIDDEFTKDDVGEVSLQVKSCVHPLTMVHWTFGLDVINNWIKEPEPCPQKKESSGFSYFGPRKPQTLAETRRKLTDERSSKDTVSDKYESKAITRPKNLIQLAMYNNDLTLLTYLLSLRQEYFQKDVSNLEETVATFFALDRNDYEYALEVGRPGLFTEIVKRTGAGLPLDELVETYGIEMKGKSKYYQGLTVHGAKRKDWAARNGSVAASPSQQTPPLLKTIDCSSHELVEWWLSDAAMRYYTEFAEANKTDKRVQRLPDFEGAARKFLTTRSHLAIHCAIMAWPTAESMRILHYLIQVMPQNLQAKNLDGLQPLQVAFTTYHYGAAELLIEGGADQMCRDHAGRNLVHVLLDGSGEDSDAIARLKAMLNLIDKRLVNEMFLQRSGSLTPLASWIEKACERSVDDKGRVEVLDTILSYSGGKELSFINGEGETPLHHAVKNEDALLTQAILAHDPTLLNRENATGRTPFEMAEDSMIASMCSDPPPMPTDWKFAEKRAIRYGLPSHWQEDILRKAEEDFAEDRQKPVISAKHRVWQVLQNTRAELLGEGKAKRRLVTLHEANEVARRLAGMKPSRPQVDSTSEVASEKAGVAVTDEVRELSSRSWSQRWYEGWERVRSARLSPSSERK